MFGFLRRPPPPPAPDVPLAFGRKCAWLAIRSGSVLEVSLALKLARPQPANWAVGLERADAGQVFVSPVVGEWVLAISTQLPEAAASLETLQQMLIRLSQKFGEAQYFASHRVSAYHAWAKAQQGQIVRAYAFLGETGACLWNAGAATPEEVELNFDFAAETDPAQPAAWQADEESVLAVARRWSVDPQFATGAYAPGLGVTGNRRPYS